MAKSFTDKLRERRAFVESCNQMGGAMQRYGRGGGDPAGTPMPPDLATVMQGMVQQNPAMANYLQQRNAYNTDSQNQLGAQVADQINNGVNGSAIDPVAALGVLKDLYTSNQNASNSLFQMLTQGAQQDQANKLESQRIANEEEQTKLNKASTQAQLLKSGMVLNSDGTVTWGQTTADGKNPSGYKGLLFGPQAEAAVMAMPGGSDLLKGITDPDTKTQVVASILGKYGSVGAYKIANNLGLAPEDQKDVAFSNNTLQELNRVENALNQKNSVLADVLDNPAKKALAQTLANSGHQELMTTLLGLKPQDAQALGDLIALGAMGDKNLSGGRLTGYLSQALQPAQPGLGKSSEQNKETLKTLKDNLLTGLQAYAQSQGYDDYSQLPGVNASLAPSTYQKLSQKGHSAADIKEYMKAKNLRY